MGNVRYNPDCLARLISLSENRHLDPADEAVLTDRLITSMVVASDRVATLACKVAGCTLSCEVAMTANGLELIKEDGQAACR